MAAIDLNRATTGVYLTPEQSNEIWTDTLNQSAVTQLATKVALPGRGAAYDTLTDTGAATWVGETEEIAVDRPHIGNKIMKPFKLAKIIPVSNEFVRDKSALWNTIKTRASQAIAQGIDETFLTGVIGLPSQSNVDSLSDAKTVSIGKGGYKDFANIATTVLENDGDFNGVALSPPRTVKVPAGHRCERASASGADAGFHHSRLLLRRPCREVPVGPRRRSHRRQRQGAGREAGNLRRGR